MKYVRKLPLEERMKLYHQALELRRRGVPIKTIAKTLGISRKTVESWIYKGCKPDTRVYSVRLTSSKELAYILGLFLGDGTVTKHSSKKKDKVVVIRTKYSNHAIKISETLRKLGLNPSIYLDRKSKYNKRWNDLYAVRVFSRRFVEFIESVTASKIREMIRGHEIDFLRGFYEAEGSLSYNKRIKQLHIRITNTNYEYMELVRDILQLIGFNVNVRRRRGTKKPAYEIELTGNNICRRFLKIVNPLIKNEIKMQV